jgi:rSAM/selenodomain-associated transferase 1
MSEAVAVAVLAKAPLPGLAKTRLIPALGAEGAARLHARLIRHAATAAAAAGTGPVTLWGAPDERHPVFQELRQRLGIALACQPDGDLGTRMLSAVAAAGRACLVIGADCPALDADHLHQAAAALREGCDAVLIPAEDGGYVLIGMRAPEPALFSHMPWGTPDVMQETRRRLAGLGRRWREPLTLWDLDRPADLARLDAIGAGELLRG